jgi:hypothetical protein
MENNQNPNQDEDIKRRVCKECNNIKSLLEFPQNRNSKTVSYRHRCKDCEKIIKKEQNKKFYQKKKEKNKQPNV